MIRKAMRLGVGAARRGLQADSRLLGCWVLPARLLGRRRGLPPSLPWHHLPGEKAFPPIFSILLLGPAGPHILGRAPPGGRGHRSPCQTPRKCPVSSSGIWLRVASPSSPNARAEA